MEGGVEEVGGGGARGGEPGFQRVEMREQLWPVHSLVSNRFLNRSLLPVLRCHPIHYLIGLLLPNSRSQSMEYLLLS